MSSVISLLKDLVNIPSPGGQEEKVCQFVFEFLEKNGFLPTKITDEISGFNILVKIGQPKVYLSAHLDTVPTPLLLKETESQIIGRGACDTKGSAASMIMAAIKAKEKGLSNFGLIFTVGEETDFRGAKKIVEREKEIPFVVVGEPTELKIVNGHFGFLELKIITRGKSAHSSEPWKGINAIERLLTALERFKKIELSPETTANLGVITGGTAVNIIPDLAEVKISFRISPQDNKDYFKETKETLGNLAEVEKSQEIKGVYTPVPEGITVRYCTELSLFRKGYVLGPGKIENAHSDHEVVEKAELEKAVDIYFKILEDFA